MSKGKTLLAPLQPLDIPKLSGLGENYSFCLFGEGSSRALVRIFRAYILVHP